MKKVFLFLMLIIVILRAEAQVNIGLNINPGLGYIRSSSLNQIISLERVNDSKVLIANARTGFGFNIGVGGFYQYNINSKLSILAEPSISHLFTRTYLNYTREDINKDGSGFQTRVASIAKVSMFYLNIPIVVRYTIWEQKKVFLVGGFSANINAKPKLKSEEMRVETEYLYESVRSSEIIKYNYQTTLDNYKIFQPHLVLGVGKNFRRKLKNLSVDLRYSLPLTKGNLYSSEAQTEQQTLNNSVYSSQDEWQMGNSSQSLKRPDNYRMGVINFSIKYILIKKTNS